MYGSTTHLGGSVVQSFLLINVASHCGSAGIELTALVVPSVSQLFAVRSATAPITDNINLMTSVLVYLPRHLICGFFFGTCSCHTYTLDSMHAATPVQLLDTTYISAYI